MSAGRLKHRDGTSSSPIETAVYWQIGRAWVSLATLLTDCDSCPGGSLMIPHADRRGLTRREVLATGLGAVGLAATGTLVTGRPAVARPTGATGASEGDYGPFKMGLQSYSLRGYTTTSRPLLEVHARLECDRSVRPGNQFGNGLDVDRLGYVVIHAGLLRSSPILFLSVARKGDDEDVMKTFLTQGSGNLITVHDGQAYVQQEDAGSISPGGLDSRAAIEDNLNLMAEQTQQPGQAGCKVPVVVHDQDPTLLRRLGLIHRRTRRHGNHGNLLGVSGRKPRREGASFTVPIAPWGNSGSM